MALDRCPFPRLPVSPAAWGPRAELRRARAAPHPSLPCCSPCPHSLHAGRHGEAHVDNATLGGLHRQNGPKEPAQNIPSFRRKEPSGRLVLEICGGLQDISSKAVTLPLWHTAVLCPSPMASKSSALLPTLPASRARGVLAVILTNT